MPGIYGFILKKRHDRSYAENLIKRMGRLQRHNENYRIREHFEDWYGLGEIGIPQADFIKLKHDSESAITVAHDGYVYGTGGGHAFPKAEQIDCFPLYFKQDRRNIPSYFNGSFNAACFDNREKEAVIFNDRFGHRILYYYETEDIFLFASEFKAFYACEEFRAEVNRDCVKDFFNYTFPMGVKTFLAGVTRLRWGHRIDFHDGNITIKPYHEFEFVNESTKSIDQFIDEGYALYQDNLKRQTVGCDSIVIPLSGGLDSRMVIGHAAQSELPVYAYTHGTKGCLDEVAAKKAAKAAGLMNHSLVEIDPQWVTQYAESLIFLTGGVIPTVPVVLLGVVRQYNHDPVKTALLNGISGRTAFAYGYFNTGDIRKDVTRQEKIRKLRRPLFADTVDDSYYAMFTPDFILEAKESYDRVIGEELDKHKDISEFFCHQRDLFMLENRFRRQFDLVDVNRYFWHDHMALEDSRTLDFYMSVPPNLKVYPARAMLVEGLKRKFPHLAAVQTQNTGVSLFETRSAFGKKMDKLFKKAAYYSERLTRGLLKFPNKTTYVNFNQWYREYPQIREMFEDTLLDSRTLSRGYFNKRRIEEILIRQRRGGNSYNDLALLLTFELFCRIYIDSRDFSRFLVREK